MAEENDIQVQDTQSTEVDDPWAAAFAALDSTQQEDNESIESSDRDENGAVDESSHTADTAGKADDNASQGDNGQPADADNPAAGDGAGDEGFDGGLDSGAGDSLGEAKQAGGDLLGVTDDELEGLREGLAEEARDQAINDVAQEFIKRGIMHQNGKLGATVTDPLIMQRDDDGVPHFYNPETKREFTGENPRKQAQEWCDEYNRELASAFNEACENYSAKLIEQQSPAIQVLEFAPTYNKLDPITKAMLDNVIEDYEITDSDGKITGYSCDLNKAHAMVQRQIASIQAHAKSRQEAKIEEATSPALDMKASGVSPSKNNSAPPKSLEEAMERLQNQQLEKLRSK